NFGSTYRWRRWVTTTRLAPRFSEFGGDLLGADRAARDEYALIAVRCVAPVLVGGAHACRACEPIKPGNRWDRWGLESPGRHRHAVEPLGRAGVGDNPSDAVSAEYLDASAEPDARHEAERLGIAMEVGEDVAARRVDEVGLVLEVTERRQHATGVGVHRRPHTA